jgi:hypothetical protein
MLIALAYEVNSSPPYLQPHPHAYHHHHPTIHTNTIGLGVDKANCIVYNVLLI